jgi:hypothetical protein
MPASAKCCGRPATGCAPSTLRPCRHSASLARVRKPRIRVARVGRGRNDIADAIADWLAYAIAADGGEPVARRPGGEVEALLTGGGVDAVAMIGGTGAGGRDDTVHALARTGSVEAHGIALLPGETAAFGIANSRPVLLMPGPPRCCRGRVAADWAGDTGNAPRRHRALSIAQKQLDRKNHLDGRPD